MLWFEFTRNEILPRETSHSKTIEEKSLLLQLEDFLLLLSDSCDANEEEKEEEMTLMFEVYVKTY